MLCHIEQQAGGVALEVPLCQFPYAALHDLCLFHCRPENMGLALFFACDIAFLFQASQQGLDGGIGDLSRLGQGLVDILHGGIADLPDQRKNLRLGGT